MHGISNKSRTHSFFIVIFFPYVVKRCWTEWCVSTVHKLIHRFHQVQNQHSLTGVARKEPDKVQPKSIFIRNDNFCANLHLGHAFFVILYMNFKCPQSKSESEHTIFWLLLASRFWKSWEVHQFIFPVATETLRRITIRKFLQISTKHTLCFPSACVSSCL